MKALNKFTTLVAFLAFVAMIGLGIRALAVYPNSFLTTSDNFVHLEVVAPMLYKSIIICIVVTFVSGIIAYLTRNHK